MCIHNVSIHINFYQNRFINECVRKNFSNSQKDRWPFVTFNDLEVILIYIKYLHIHDISIHINFYQNWFINECVMKNFLKFSERQTWRRKDVKTEFFLWDVEELTFLKIKQSLTHCTLGKVHFVHYFLIFFYIKNKFWTL